MEYDEFGFVLFVPIALGVQGFLWYHTNFGVFFCLCEK
jgi:hypothetical protein